MVSKYPSEDLRLGTQLVVYPGQTAFFVKSGRILDEFESGTYTLISENIPLLNEIVNLPFGGKSPFKAEVWFVNRLAILDTKWGTSSPIMLEDPKYHIIVPVRAYGQYGLKVINPRLFLETLVGNMSSFSTQKVDNYFKGKVISQLSTLISTKITKENLSILEIPAYLDEMSHSTTDTLNNVFDDYGLQVVEFAYQSINFPSDDPSFIKLREAKDLAARLQITGRDVYQMDRSFDVMEGVAQNEGPGGGLASAGVGVGIGLGALSGIKEMTAQHLNTNPTPQPTTSANTPPPLPIETLYFAYVGGKQIDNLKLTDVAQLISNGDIKADTLI